MGNLLAIDLGASSGRAMLAQYGGGKITIQELVRFSNDPVMLNGTLYWDFLRFMFNIKKGITAAVNAGGFDTLGIDTWGVDFGFIDKRGQLLTNPVHYRDKRTDGFKSFPIPMEELYRSTGIQQLQINSLYQLGAIAKDQPEVFEDAQKILFMPDLLNYFLCGQMKAEYTMVSTSQLLDAKARDWDFNIIDKVGIPRRLFCGIVQPGTICGPLSPEIREELGAPAADVVCIAAHDTAAAVAAVPTQEKDFIYISSGTWSLLGTELEEPIINDLALKYNFTNEGGVNRSIRFLKNIMGTWIIAEARRQWAKEGNEYSFGELEKMAQAAEPLQSFIDVDHADFIKPGNMPRRIAEHCKRTGQKVPETPGEFVRCIDESLAMKYRLAIGHVEDCTGKNYSTVNIVGGGVKSALLCSMTASASNKKVIAGPDEATVFGNVAMQLMAKGVLKDVWEVRRVVAASSETTVYEPRGAQKWDEAYGRYLKVLEG